MDKWIGERAFQTMAQQELRVKSTQSINFLTRNGVEGGWRSIKQDT